MTTRLTYELSRVSLPKMLYGRITVVLHLELYGNFCITNVFFRCLFDPMKTPGFAWLPKEFGDSFPLCPFYLRSGFQLGVIVYAGFENPQCRQAGNC